MFLSRISIVADIGVQLPSIKMITVDTANVTYVHCNRCHAETPHEMRGGCKKTDCVHDDDSKTDIHFSETYSLLQCQICGQARLRQVLWNSENDESAPQFFPPPSHRRTPLWISELDYPVRVLLREVYRALESGLYSIALMGVRAVLDVWVSSQTSGRNDFPKKLSELAKIGTLSAQQVEVLASTFDAGSAAIHRGYAPSLADTIAATEAVENLLHQHGRCPARS